MKHNVFLPSGFVLVGAVLGVVVTLVYIIIGAEQLHLVVPFVHSSYSVSLYALPLPISLELLLGLIVAQHKRQSPVVLQYLEDCTICTDMF